MDWDSGRQWGSSAPKVGGGGRCVCVCVREGRQFELTTNCLVPIPD